MYKDLSIGQSRYEAAMRLHIQDVAEGRCRKCDRVFKSQSKLREHYQSDAHRKQAARWAKTRKG